MPNFYQPDNEPRRFRTQDPLNKVTNLSVKTETHRAEASDPLSLDNVSFVLSRIYPEKPTKNKKRTRKPPKTKEVAAATVSSVEGSLDDGFDISLHFCALTAGEPLEFSQTLRVLKPNPANLDDYHSRVEAAGLKIARLRVEFRYLLREIGKIAFANYKNAIAASQSDASESD